MCQPANFMQPGESIDLSRLWSFIRCTVAVLVLLSIFAVYSVIMVRLGYEAAIVDYKQHLRANDYVCPESRPFLCEPTKQIPEPRY